MHILIKTMFASKSKYLVLILNTEEKEEFLVINKTFKTNQTPG